MTAPPLSREAWLAAAIAAERAVPVLLHKGFVDAWVNLQRRAAQMRERARAAA